jgi:flagellar protein FliS
MSTAGRAAGAYRSTQVGSRSPVELVAMLYDGLMRFLTQARDGLATGDLRAKRAGISGALGVLTELQNTLDMEKGGDMAVRLQALYAYISSRVIESNVNRNVAGIEEALKLVAPLREAWTDIAAASPAVKVSA